MNGHDSYEANSEPIDFSGLIATQIKLINKTQKVLLEATHTQTMDYYSNLLSRQLQQLGHLVSLQGDIRRYSPPDGSPFDRTELMGEVSHRFH